MKTMEFYIFDKENRKITWQETNVPKRTPQEDRIREVEDRLEIIYSQSKTPDFVEIKGEIGGDLLCCRVYNDGSICEK